MKAQPNSGALVLSDDLKNPALEKLDLVRKWSINTYKVILPVLNLLLCPFSLRLLLLPAFVPTLYLLPLVRIVGRKVSYTPQTKKDLSIFGPFSPSHCLFYSLSARSSCVRTVAAPNESQLSNRPEPSVCVLRRCLSSAVHQADPFREAGPRLQDRGHGAGGPN